jgi:hypothetical protein
MARLTGTVKWFNDAKGFGFIAREVGRTSSSISAPSSPAASRASPKAIRWSSRSSRGRRGRRPPTSAAPPEAHAIGVVAPARSRGPDHRRPLGRYSVSAPQRSIRAGGLRDPRALARASALPPRVRTSRRTFRAEVAARSADRARHGSACARSRRRSTCIATPSARFHDSKPSACARRTTRGPPPPPDARARPEPRLPRRAMSSDLSCTRRAPWRPDSSAIDVLATAPAGHARLWWKRRAEPTRRSGHPPAIIPPSTRREPPRGSRQEELRPGADDNVTIAQADAAGPTRPSRPDAPIDPATPHAEPPRPLTGNPSAAAHVPRRVQKTGKRPERSTTRVPARNGEPPMGRLAATRRVQQKREQRRRASNGAKGGKDRPK